MIKVRLTIPLNPIPKKNNMQLITTGKRPRLIPSARYLQYEKDCGYFIKRLQIPIDYKVNIKAVYYRATKHKIDLINLHEALFDILVKCGVLKDDESRIVHSTNGSYVDYDKGNPHTEIEIWEV